MGGGLLSLSILTIASLVTTITVSLLLPHRATATPPTIALSLNPNTINLNIPTEPTANGIVTGGINATISTNAALGYNLTLSSTTNNTNLDHTNPNTGGDGGNNTIPTITTPGSLTTNTWGYTLDNPYNNPNSNTYQPITPITNPATIADKDSASIVGTVHGVWYSVKVANPNTLPSGTYTQSVIYTATAKLPPAPTITNITPNTYEIGSEQSNPGANKLTITGTNLQTTQEVYIDSNNNNKPDNGEHCTNLTITNNTTVSCTIPTNLNPGKYNVILTTQGGTTIPNTNSTITYIKPIPPKSVTVNYGTNTGTVTIDYDANMIPIRYTGNTTNPQWTSVSDTEITNNPSTWFNYPNKQWANAVTVKKESLSKYQNKSATIDNNDVLGYWVYIPRYAYEVMRPNATDKYVTAQNFDIRFEKATDTKKTPADTCNILNPTKEQMWANGTPGGAESNILAKDYRTQCGISRTYGNATGTTWATHPAFTWKNSTGTINKELNGIWVGKFETTGTKSKPTIKPNQHANIEENIGEFYNAAKSIGKADPNNTGGGANSDDTTSNLTQNSHNMATATTHMLKNSEWGAITYLSASKYGAGVNNVQINSAYPSTSADADGNSSNYGITGCGPNGTASSPTTSTYTDGTPLDATTIESETACSKSTDRSYTSEIGQLASTTNNIYGVYDMSGGTYEYVMGNRTTSTTQTTSSTSYFKTPTSEPYVDLYITTDADGPFGKPQVWSREQPREFYYNNDACTWLTCGGHALHETKTVQSVSSNAQSWGSDYSNFVGSSGPWFLRGGGAYSGSYAGVFASYDNGGYASSDRGFRAAALCGA